MRAPRRLIAFAAVAALVGAACGSDSDSDSSAENTDATETTDAPDSTEATTETTEATTETTEYQAPARGDADLVIWADDTRAPVLKPIADEFGELEGITVQVVEVPFDQIRDQLSIAGPAGEGPDIVTGAHDWLGELVSNGVIAPIDLGADADLYAPVSIEAFTYDGALYGVPYAIENIALIRNVDLVPEAPATFEDLEATALALQADGTVDVPLAVQQDPGDPFHNYPLFSACRWLRVRPERRRHVQRRRRGHRLRRWPRRRSEVRRLEQRGLISKDVSYDIMIESFSTGTAPFAITGPWAVGSFTDAGINFVVEPIPTSPVAPPRCSWASRASCSRRSARTPTSRRPSWSTTSTPKRCSSPSTKPAVARRPCSRAYDQVSSDPIIQGFGAAGQQGTPLPAIPEMSAVWESWTDAYSLIFTGSDPVQAFTDAATQIREKIAEG